MNNQDIAKITHEINRAYCKALGDDSQPSWETAPEWQRESAMAGVNHYTQHTGTTPEQSHELWLEHKLADGWVYGATKDAAAKTHPYIKPFDELSEMQKAKDFLFGAVVKQLMEYAVSLNRRGADTKPYTP